MNLLFAAEGTEHVAEGLPLGLNASAFAIQLITFVLVFMVLKRFAFKPIARMLEKRRQTIEDGVKLGIRMEKERAKLDKEIADVMRDARAEADKIISNGQKEAREIIRESEKAGQRKVDAMISDAEARINEETKEAKHRLEKEIVGMVSEATEAIVEEKVDATKDAKLIEKALKKQK